MDSTMSEGVASSSSSVSWPEGDEVSIQNGYGHHSPTKIKPGKKVKPKPLQEVLNKILPQLHRRDLYQFFTQPVPAAEVPEYYTIIQQPMDFSTMQRKLEQKEYQTLNSFRTDFLLITENAQYFNGIDGPSGIIHTEAKKLQEWGTRLIEREGAAVVEEMNQDLGMHLPKKAALNNGKFNIRLKKFPSPHSSAVATPRVSTPSHLNQEIKMEEDDDEGDESPDEYEASSVMGTSSRGGSVSIDGFGTPGTRDSPDPSRKYQKRTSRAPYTHKKNRPRLSAVIGLLSSSNNDEDNEGRPAMAPVSSTSGVVAAAIPLLYGPDGSIDLPRLTEDERRALLRPADLDDWPDLMTPFIESILPLNADAQPIVQSLARSIKMTVDGFGSAVLSSPAPTSSTFSYDIDSLPVEQQMPPFAVSSGHEFEEDGRKADIPLAWPRPSAPNASTSATPNSTNDYTNSNAPLRPLKGRDREKEREAAGAGNLDDWTFPRARLAKLIEPLDLGLYPGLLPAAWINHIRSSKGGPGRSRLPPFYLSTGHTFVNALQDELASLPNRVLLDGKPGAFNDDAAVPDPPLDVCTALARGASQDWKASEREQKKAGVRGSDVVREVVFGGALGEAYTSSVFNFINGAAQSVLDRQSNSLDAEEETESKEQSPIVRQTIAKEDLSRVAPSYFDDAGEMLDKDGYIGMGLIPLEVRKEAGLSSQSLRLSSIQPSSFGIVTDRKRASRDPSVALLKRQRLASTPLEERVKMEFEDDVILNEEKTSHDEHLKSFTSAYLSGAILSTSLCEYIRDKVISPLTGGLLDVLIAAGEEAEGKSRQGDGDKTDWDDFGLQFDDLLDISNQSLDLPTTENREDLIRKLTKKMLTGEYKRAMWQMTELTRAKEDVIELDSLVHLKDEMLSEIVQQTDQTKPLRWSSVQLDSSNVSKALEQYAQILTTLSNKRNEMKSAPLTSEALGHLRLAYIALAKLVPTKDLGRGQWAAWAEYLQQQLAAHLKQNQAQKK